MLEEGTTYAIGSRKSGVRAWTNSESKISKDYYFDSRGDRDNLAFGCLYRMDLAHYKLINSAKQSGIDFQAMRRQKEESLLDKENDIDALDSKIKSSGRYWSSRYAALEHHKTFKRIRFVAPQKPAIVNGDFVPLLDLQTPHEGVDVGSLNRTFAVEESWEDEVYQKTRDFNKMTRECPHDEKVWLDFAEFQDRVASMQKQKGARVQTLEKKISILEKATELNPDNEQLLLSLLKAYQSRDSTDVLIDRWEKILMQHSGSYKLWREFLQVFKGEFSRFKVSEIRKMYSHAIQALSASCIKQYRQVNHAAKLPVMDPTRPDQVLAELELGLVDIFLSLCRFEWQSGYHELATALFQAEIEYSLFSPSLLLTEQSKQRLFEHFWNSSEHRIGEDGALGWSTWLEKEEENRQRIIREESSRENEQVGWTGWFKPTYTREGNSVSPDVAEIDNAINKDSEEELEVADTKQEDDTEALMKMLGIDVNAEGDEEVKDTSTWTRWSEEELSRDCNQWLPVHASSGSLPSDGAADGEGDEQISRVILYEDVSEFLFSLGSGEARLSLVFQFIDFFGGKTSQWVCTNSSSWTEQILSLDRLPDSISEDLRRVYDVLTRTQSSGSTFSLESLLENPSDESSRRTNMIKFVRNAALLCLKSIPGNYILQESVLVAEELSQSRMNSSSGSVTPCRSLAKCLLKSDRQDLLLCGVYARREAVFGNIDHARKVFDMALSSIDVLPLDIQSKGPLLYFWYAEAELANSSESSSLRAVHILSCLGSGVKYTPFKCQASSLQLLRAHQGFKERIRTLRSRWAHGAIDDPSIAIICSAALFEGLTTGWAVGIEVLEQAFSMVLPERRSQSYPLEFLFDYYVSMLQKHLKQSKLAKLWDAVLQGLQIYPSNPKLLETLVEVGHRYTVSNRLRWIFDDFCHKKPSVVVTLFALSFEISRWGLQHRIHGLFERALENNELRHSVILWRCYIAYEISIARNPSAAKRVFFRAIHACPWSKRLWLDGFTRLTSVLTAKELSDLQEVMRDKEINLRTDIYEILLQDEIKS